MEYGDVLFKAVFDGPRACGVFCISKNASAGNFVRHVRKEKKPFFQFFIFTRKAIQIIIITRASVSVLVGSFF